jgi:hypothetical protein
VVDYIERVHNPDRRKRLELSAARSTYIRAFAESGENSTADPGSVAVQKPGSQSAMCQPQGR